MSFCGLNAMGIVRASCNVIVVSACWLFNRALVRTPPGTCAGGMINTGDVSTYPWLIVAFVLLLGMAPTGSMLLLLVLFLGEPPMYYCGFVCDLCAPL